LSSARITANEPTAANASRGQTLLVKKTYLPRHYDQQLFDPVEEVGPELCRSTAEDSTSKERQKLRSRALVLTTYSGGKLGLPRQLVVDCETQT